MYSSLASRLAPKGCWLAILGVLLGSCGPRSDGGNAPETVTTVANELTLSPVCPPAQAGTDLIIYDDALENCFVDLSWARHSLVETTYVHSGAYSVRFAVKSLGALWFHRNSIPEPYGAIEFWVYSSAPKQRVGLVVDAGIDIISHTLLSDILGKPLEAGVWQKIRVDFDWPAAAQGGINVLLVAVGLENQGTMYVDDMRLVAPQAPGPCEGAPAGASCSDGNACNGEEVCDGFGACLAGTPPIIDDSNACTADSCDPTLGVLHVPVIAGTTCSDSNACNGMETCDGAGTCLAGTAPVVDDGNPCTADACDPVQGVTHTPLAAGAACPDGDACNGEELCDGASACLAGTAPVIDDGNPCTADACDPVLGVLHDPVIAGTTCSDGNACNGDESCDGFGICLAGLPPAIDDSNACTADSCDPALGVLHVPVIAGTTCSDSNACNGMETCDGAGVCLAGVAPVLDDGNPCTADACDPVQGVTHAPVAVGTSCTDGNACNGLEACDGSGTCLAGTAPVIDDGSPCTADSCDPIQGVIHTPVTVGTACLDDNLCNGNETCNGSGICVAGTPPVLDDGDPCTADSCIPSTGVVHSPIPGCGVLPPDPSTVAPPTDLTVATDIASATAFLYSGTNPIQTGVAEGTIEAKRVAIIRGKVSGRDGNPVSGTTITILNHAEYGQTISRADGMFDMAVNGGGQVTLNYQKDGYVPVQRQVQAPWRDYVWADEVVLVPYDTMVSAVALGASITQVARGNPVTDYDGTRQATILFPSGTQASMLMPDGTTQPLAAMHVRATEYTVGDLGRASMPAVLPPASAYTYAVELSVDEAMMGGARAVIFSQPVPVYLENFLNIPVGTPVPSGYYDRQRAEWVPSDDGRVIKILSTDGGVATIDTNGDGVADTAAMLAALGVTAEELQQFATLYAAGQTLWRVPVPHFTAWDFNYAWGCEVDSDGNACAPPDSGDPLIAAEPESDPDTECGSVIECQNQGLGEDVDIVGTSFHLSYRSMRQLGRKAERRVTIRPPTKVSSKALGIVYEVSVAGQRLQQRLPTTDQSIITFVWDGRDAYGRPYQGSAPVIVRIGFLYAPVYAVSAGDGVRSFGNSGRGGYLPPNMARYCEGPCPGGGDYHYDGLLVSWRTWYGTLSSWTALPRGLGGWTLSEHHVYDPVAQVLYRGDGSRRAATQFAPHIINTVAVTGWPVGLAIGPDGSVYTAENSVVNKIDPTGYATRFAGGGSCATPQSGVPATQVCLHTVYDLSMGPDGSLYLAGTPSSSSAPVRRIRPDGIIEDFAGVDSTKVSTAPLGDGGPALQARIAFASGVTVSQDGTVYILADDRIRKVSTDGIIQTFAGSGASCCQGGSCGTCCNTGDNGQALQAGVCGGGSYGKIAAGPDGSVYLADPVHAVIRRVRTDGIIERFAGTGVNGFTGDGGKAKQAQIGRVEGVSVASDGSVYIADDYFHRIRRVSTQGIITTVAGSGADTNGIPTFAGDGGPATAAKLRQPWHAIVAPSGELYIGDSWNGRVRRVGAPLPGFSLSDLIIASDDGRELYVFDTHGRHLRTLDAFTKSMLYQFGYDTSGLLVSVTDRNGLVTTIELSKGKPTAIVAPYGQRTILEVDDNGYLSAIINPAGESSSYSYNADGLMLTYTDPRSNPHSFGHDDVGRLLTDANPAGGSKTLSRVDRTDGYTVSVTTALGRSTLHDVIRLSTNDERRTLTQPDGTATVSTEYTNGTKSITSPDGTVSSVTYGPDPRFGMQSPVISTTVRTPAGVSLSVAGSRTATLATPNDPLSATSLGQTVTVNSRAYSATYTVATRTTVSKTPANRSVTTILDDKGRLSQLQPPGVNAMSFTYNGQGQLQTVTRGSRIYTIGYDAQGYPQTITDPLLRTVSFTYDQAGRVKTQTLPGSRTVVFDYDRSGNLTSLTPPGRPAHSFGYTAIDLTSSYTPPAASNTGLTSTTYNYDLDGALSGVLLPGETTIVPGYDAFGRLETVTSSRGTVSLGYDSAGRVATLTTADTGLSYGYDGFLVTSETSSGAVAGTVAWTYDNDFRVSTTSVNGSSVTYQYDADSLLTGAGALTISRETATGRISDSTLGTVTTSQGYNAYGELESFGASQGGTSLYSYTLSRDAAGRIDGKTETAQGTTDTYIYGYDDAGRLATVTKNGVQAASYLYDANGNRQQKTSSAGTEVGSYDDQDRMYAFGAASYAYRPNGELATKTIAGQTTSYDYDQFGNLRGVVLPDGTTIEYVIDGQNRRIGKKVNGALEEGFLYEGQLRPVAWVDGTGAVKARFVYVTRVNVPEYMIVGSTTYRFVTDHLGSPRLVIDTTTGTVAQRLDYDEWGIVVSDSNPGFQPFGFAGGLWDRDTGLVRFGARDYDAIVGRWVNKDSVRFSGGDTNVYVYAGNNPIDRTDPSGFYFNQVDVTMQPYMDQLRSTPSGNFVISALELSSMAVNVLNRSDLGFKPNGNINGGFTNIDPCDPDTVLVYVDIAAAKQEYPSNLADQAIMSLLLHELTHARQIAELGIYSGTNRFRDYGESLESDPIGYQEMLGRDIGLHR